MLDLHSFPFGNYGSGMATNEAALIAKAVDAYRIDFGMTALDLSITTGIPNTTLDRRLKGQVDFSVSELIAVSSSLNVRPGSWFDTPEAVLP